MPDDLNFAGESMPLENPDILERMDRELLVNTYWQSNGLLMFKRAKKYFSIIEPILAKNGVPDDFKYLAVIESGLTNAVSPAGARGVWQIMPATGRENGLEVNKQNIPLPDTIKTSIDGNTIEIFDDQNLTTGIINQLLIEPL